MADGKMQAIRLRFRKMDRRALDHWDSLARYFCLQGEFSAEGGDLVLTYRPEEQKPGPSLRYQLGDETVRMDVHEAQKKDAGHEAILGFMTAAMPMLETTREAGELATWTAVELRGPRRGEGQ